MFAKTGLLIVAFVVCVVNGKPFEVYDDATNQANQFVDAILKTVMDKYKGQLDPFHIPDKKASFSKKIGLITLHGSADLTEGTITGLGRLYRSGDSTLGTDQSNHFKAHIKFGDNNIKVHYKAEAEFEDIKTSATLEASVGDIQVEVSIGIDGDGKAQLTEFKIDELQHVKVDVHTPVKVIDPLIDLLADGFVEVFNPLTRDVLSKILKDMVGKELGNFKIGG